MITRIFHPIGQGAFYTERFGKINIVYDCGTTKCRTIGEKVVKQSFKSTDEIDILFISHFHADHISNIKTLKKHCKLIKNVVLPVLSDIEKILIISIYKALGLEEEAYLIENIDSYFGDKTKIIYVKEDGDKKEENIGNEPIDIERIENNEEIESGTVLELSSIKILNWCFVPYNPKDIERKMKLKDEFKDNDDITIENVTQKDSGSYVADKVDEIKKIYKKVYKYDTEINKSSMLVYSGPLKKNKDFSLLHVYKCSIFHYYGPNNRLKDSYRVGCIYTGDTNFNKIDNIRKIYKKYWCCVGTIQIPHHGSIENFNENFFDDEFYFCPISFGKNNSHGHPSTFVIGSIIRNNAVPVFVNESLNSIFVQIIEKG
ncbi:MAG: MBL fold metallo-hydrolase [Methanobacteriaceae archaeon]